ncbi:YDG domain-containing protein [Marvinbryantia formatexigens]|nr:YDG domain-containing protein [Marvinbryantia formatexigens]UWO24895.1 hypothetical protein NQ534_21245 [Marvinbryantia formatexigens DSM 14469]SDG77169.1 hypothetical protein SAMN05660368_03230 [Marvinbryantia formatexigens]
MGQVTRKKRRKRRPAALAVLLAGMLVMQTAVPAYAGEEAIIIEETGAQAEQTAVLAAEASGETAEETGAETSAQMSVEAVAETPQDQTEETPPVPVTETVTEAPVTETVTEAPVETVTETQEGTQTEITADTEAQTGTESPGTQGQETETGTENTEAGMPGDGTEAESGPETETESETETETETETEEIADMELQSAGTTAVCAPDAGSLPDNDTLYAGYAQRILYGGISLYSSSYGESTLTGLDLKIYRLLKERITAVASGTASSTSFTLTWEELGITQTTWTEEELGVPIWKDENKPMNGLAEEAEAAVLKGIGYDAGRVPAIISALLADCPYELYWYDKSAGTEYTQIPVMGASYIKGNSSIYFLDKGITISFSVAGDYAGDGTYTTDTSKTGAASRAAATAQQVVNDNAGKTDVEKLTAYKDYICSAVSYNSAAAGGSMSEGGNPWQLIYVFDGDSSTNVVCEGYAKAFQYLCDLGGLTCYTVTGTMTGGTGAGAHMWNIVTLDGKNYLVDVTNSDEGTVGQNGGLFLAGTSGSVDGGYSFTANGQGVSYTYDGDTKALYGSGILSLADMGYGETAAASVEADGVTAEYADIMEAFGSIQDGQTATVTLLKDVEIEAGKKITVSGDVTLVGDGHTLSGTYTDYGISGLLNIPTGAKLTITSGIFVNSSLAYSKIYTVYVNGGTLVIGGGTITATGSNGDAAAVWVNSGSAEISGGTFTGTVSGYYSGYGIYDNSNGNAKLASGTFTGSSSAVYVISGKVSNLLETGYIYYKDGSYAAGDSNSLGSGTYTVVKCENHSWGAWSDAGDGTHTHACEYCGKENAESHNWGSWSNDTASGRHVHICEVCGASEGEAHEWGTGETDSSGNYILTCTKCDAQAVASVSRDGGRTADYYVSIEEAWAAAKELSNGDTQTTLTLLQNVTVSTTLTVESGDDIIFASAEGTDHTLFGDTNETDGGLINITGGTFTLASGTVKNGENGSNAIAVSGGGKFIMNGGSAVAQADGHSGICVYSGGTAEINGGSASGYNGLAIVDGGSGTVSGGTFTGTYLVADNSAAVLLRNVSGTLQTILEEKKAYYEVKDDTKTLITDMTDTRLYGTVTVEDCTHSCESWTDDGGGENHSGICVVCKAPMSEPHDWDENGKCTAVGCTAQAAASVTVNGEKSAYYATIEKAWQAAKGNAGGATVTLFSDVTVASALTVDGNDNITLTSEVKNDGNDTYTISGNGSAVISISGGSLTLEAGTVAGREMYSSSGVTITGGSFYMEDGSVSGYMALDIQNGEVYISGGSVKGGTSEGGYGINAIGGRIELTGGTYYGESAAIINMDSGLQGVAVSNLLVEGYAFKQNDSWVSDTSISELKGTVTVAKVPIQSVSISPATTTITYGDTATTLTATVTQPDDSANAVTYQWYLNGEEIAGATGETYTPDKLDAGEYAYICTATVDGYSLSGTAAAVTVNRADIENAVVTLKGTRFEYLGGTLEIGVQSVELNGTKLNYGTDYTYSGYTGKDADTYTVKVEGKGNYTGTATATWEIYPRELNVKDWTIEKIYDGMTDIVLNGTEFQLDGGYPWYGQDDDIKLDASGVTAQFSDASAGEGKDITYTGEFTLTGKDAGNYILKEMPASLTGTITQRKITVTPDSLTKEYGADDPELTYQLTSGSLLAGHTLTLGRAEGESEGSYAINTFTIVDEDGNDVAGNYDVILEAVDFQITRSDLATATVTLEQDSFIYDGTEHKPTVTVVKNGNTLTEGTDYTVTYEKNVDAGTASVTITAVENGNYYGTRTVEFKIEKATPNLGTVGYTGTIYPDTALADVVLTRTDDTVPGTLALKAGQTLIAGTGEYDWTFIPQDTDNYNEVTGTVTLEVVTDPDATAYTITIPKTAVAGGDAVSVGINKEEPFNLNGGTVSVSVSDGIDENGKLTLTNTDGSGSSVTSAMYVGETPITSFTDRIFAVFESPDDSPVSLSFKAPTETDILAGTYEGTVTFSIDYTAAEGGTTE